MGSIQSKLDFLDPRLYSKSDISKSILKQNLTRCKSFVSKSDTLKKIALKTEAL